MAHRSLLEFRCDTCHEAVRVDVTDNQEIDEDWPTGWIVVKAQIIGIEEEEEKVFCPYHSHDLVVALGYSNIGTMGAALVAVEDAKASAAAKRRIQQLRAEHGDVIVTDDGIAIIHDEEDD